MWAVTSLSDEQKASNYRLLKASVESFVRALYLLKFLRCLSQRFYIAFDFNLRPWSTADKDMQSSH